LILKGLDDLSSSELRVKVVQLATEMGERAKWEAVRLREFLALKEKEVGEK
jgi:mitofilin